MIRVRREGLMLPKGLDPHKVRGELPIRRLGVAGREERMVLKNDLEVLTLDDSSGSIGVNPRANCSKFAIHESLSA
jgi:hypothetical protein